MMKQFINRLLIIFFFAISFSANSTTLNTEPFFNRENYRKSAENFKYNTPVQSVKTEKKKPSTRNWDWLKYISYAIVIVVIVFLIYKLILYTYTPDNRKVKISDSQFQQIEEEPTIESNLTELLEAALKQNDFREAIRIYYLLSIKNLNDNHIVTYSIDKTNFEYVSEVGGHPAFLLFRELTITFERIWFGDSLANETKLNSYQSKYSDLKEVISSYRNKPVSV